MEVFKMDKKITIIVIIILLTGTFAFSYLNNDDSEYNRPEVGVEVGKSAPDFELTDLNGDSVQLSDYRGQKVFLNFWASWCPPCRAEMPDVQRLYEEDFEDFRIIAVNVGENKAVASEFIMKNNLDFEVILDNEKEVSREYLVRGIPTSYFLDENGVIINKISGVISYKKMIELAELND
jgi:thiol-disulfide isomerase/thioredoxin